MARLPSRTNREVQLATDSQERDDRTGRSEIVLVRCVACGNRSEDDVSRAPKVQWMIVRGQFDLWVVRPAGADIYGVGFQTPHEKEAKLMCAYLNNPPISIETVIKHFEMIAK